MAMPSRFKFDLGDEDTNLILPTFWKDLDLILKIKRVLKKLPKPKPLIGADVSAVTIADRVNTDDDYRNFRYYRGMDRHLIHLGEAPDAYTYLYLALESRFDLRAGCDAGFNLGITRYLFTLVT